MTLSQNDFENIILYRSKGHELAIQFPTPALRKEFQDLFPNDRGIMYFSEFKDTPNKLYVGKWGKDKGQSFFELQGDEQFKAELQERLGLSESEFDSMIGRLETPGNTTNIPIAKTWLNPKVKPQPPVLVGNITLYKASEGELAVKFSSPELKKQFEDLFYDFTPQQYRFTDHGFNDRIFVGTWIDASSSVNETGEGYFEFPEAALKNELMKILRLSESELNSIGMLGPWQNIQIKMGAQLNPNLLQQQQPLKVEPNIEPPAQPAAAVDNIILYRAERNELAIQFPTPEVRGKFENLFVDTEESNPMPFGYYPETPNKLYIGKWSSDTDGSSFNLADEFKTKLGEQLGLSESEFNSIVTTLGERGKNVNIQIADTLLNPDNVKPQEQQPALVGNITLYKTLKGELAIKFSPPELRKQFERLFSPLQNNQFVVDQDKIFVGAWIDATNPVNKTGKGFFDIDKKLKDDLIKHLNLSESGLDAIGLLKTTENIQIKMGDPELNSNLPQQQQLLKAELDIEPPPQVKASVPVQQPPKLEPKSDPQPQQVKAPMEPEHQPQVKATPKQPAAQNIQPKDNQSAHQQQTVQTKPESKQQYAELVQKLKSYTENSPGKTFEEQYQDKRRNTGGWGKWGGLGWGKWLKSHTEKRTARTNQLLTIESELKKFITHPTDETLQNLNETLGSIQDKIGREVHLAGKSGLASIISEIQTTIRDNTPPSAGSENISKKGTGLN